MARTKQTSQRPKKDPPSKKTVGKGPRKQLATKASRKAAPTATSNYSTKEQMELTAAMTSDCSYCGEHVPTLAMVCNHLMFHCKGIELPEGNIKEAFTVLRRDKEVTVNAGTFGWKVCPEDGMCDLTMAQFPPGTVCAPFNWAYFAMDHGTTKAVDGIRCTAAAYEYEKPGLTRKRFYTDKRAHLEWARIIKEKIRTGEVTEVLIPATFRYFLAKQLHNLDDRNHAALIVIQIVNGQWKCYFYDSQDEKRYYRRASSQDVRKFLKRYLLGNMPEAPKEHKHDSWLLEKPIYKSLSVNGCVGVVAFWIHQRFIGQQLSDPNNTGTVNFFKALMFHAARHDNNPHSLMRGEVFDQTWKLKSTREYAVPDLDPEMDGHIADFIKRIQQLHA